MRQETTRPSSDLNVTVDNYLAARTEPDIHRRAALIERVWTAGGQLIDPPFAATGRGNIAQLASFLQVEFPGYVYLRVGGVERDRGRICFRWQFVAPGGNVVMEGVDVGDVTADGLLRRVTRHHHARGLPSTCSESDSAIGPYPLDRIA
jgi:hypothetical protein